MAFEFKLPDLGEGVAEGEVVRWLVAEGDTVAEDQPLAEVLTDHGQQLADAPLVALDVLALPAEKVGPPLWPSPSQFRREQPGDAMHGGNGPRDAPFELRPRGRYARWSGELPREALGDRTKRDGHRGKRRELCGRCRNGRCTRPGIDEGHSCFLRLRQTSAPPQVGMYAQCARFNSF